MCSSFAALLLCTLLRKANSIYTITEWIFAGWLVKSYGWWECRQTIEIMWRCLAQFVFLSLLKVIFQESSPEIDVKGEILLVVLKKKQFGNNFVDYDVKIFKTVQWNHSPAARGSTWVLNILILFLWWRRVYTMENRCWLVNSFVPLISCRPTHSTSLLIGL